MIDEDRLRSNSAVVEWLLALIALLEVNTGCAEYVDKSSSGDEIYPNVT